jgi:hypothetical protein
MLLYDFFNTIGQEPSFHRGTVTGRLKSESDHSRFVRDRQQPPRCRIAHENHRSGIPDGLGLDERQEIRVNRFGFRGGHTVREAFVGFQRATLQQFGAQ